jgi:hypothetical protein
MTLSGSTSILQQGVLPCYDLRSDIKGNLFSEFADLGSPKPRSAFPGQKKTVVTCETRYR